MCRLREDESIPSRNSFKSILLIFFSSAAAPSTAWKRLWKSALVLTTKWMGEVVPHDLVKYGLIPELVGRLPVITALDGLDQAALVRILTEPKNSILKQYKKLFALDKVELDFEKSALEAVAQKAIDRRTGARGLRSIMEETLTDLMYKVPSDYSVEKVIVDGETVKNGKEAKLIHNPDRKPVAITISETKKAPNRRKYSAS